MIYGTGIWIFVWAGREKKNTEYAKENQLWLVLQSYNYTYSLTDRYLGAK